MPFSLRDTPRISGDTTPCRVTPVVLHGVPVILHGVVSPEDEAASAFRRTAQGIMDGWRSKLVGEALRHPGDNPGANRWFL